MGESHKDEVIPKASVTKLLKRFGPDVMYLWQALLQEYAIRFSGPV